MLHKYLLRRGNSFYFRWRIPTDLRPLFGVTELISSLRTSNRLEASVRACHYIEAVAGIKLARAAYWANEIDTGVYLSKLREIWLKVRRMTRKEKTLKIGLITAGDMTFDYGGDVDKELDALKKAKDLGLLSETLIHETSIAGSEIIFSELFLDFMVHKMDVTVARKEDRKPLSDKVQKSYQLSFDTVLQIMGDVPVSSISRKMLENTLLTYGELPRRNVRPYKGLPVSELLEMDVSEADRIKDKTVLEVKKMIQSVFRYALDEEIVEASPARDLNIKLNSSSTFAHFNKNEIMTILVASRKEKVAWKKWLPSLAAYSGARRGELVQLRRVDVKIDSDSGRHYIFITDEAGSVKNENGKRQVPVHKELIDMGFLELVESAGDRLFDGLKPQAVTQWFTSFRDKLGIERFDDFGSRKVFHSFRHSFITQSLSAGNSLERIQQVVGHEKTSAGATDRYTHRLLVGEVLGVVDLVSYKPL